VNEFEIERLARAVLDSYSLQPPVDFVALCKQEGIELAPGVYGEEFHGRIEFHPEPPVFIIFHPAFEGSALPGRIRFSIAHELGHYFIDEHRELLVQGRAHNSSGMFAPARSRIEHEADRFAGVFLIPDHVIRQTAGSRAFLDLQQILSLANRCGTSAGAAAIRYVQWAEEPCVVVLCQDARIKYAVASAEAASRGFSRSKLHTIPECSGVMCCFSGTAGAFCEGQTWTDYWFCSTRNRARLWEQTYRFGSTRFTLTLLSWLDYKPDD
jgi:hypothetical protein